METIGRIWRRLLRAGIAPYGYPFADQSAAGLDAVVVYPGAQCKEQKPAVNPRIPVSREGSFAGLYLSGEIEGVLLAVVEPRSNEFDHRRSPSC
jgi:hypothetical protein